MRSLFGGIRLITIDLDDTLWPCAPVIQNAEQRLYKWLREVAPRLTEHHDIQSMREHRKALAAAQPDRAHDLTWLRHEHLTILLSEFGHDTGLADEGIRLFARDRNLVTPYDDVIPLLKAWRAKYILVSLTNGNAVVEQTSLRGLFHHHVDAAGAGAAKPDPAMFVQALGHFDVPSNAALHLGDDPRRDIVPARELGMKTLWVNRFNRSWPDDLSPPDAQIPSFHELLAEKVF